MAVASDRCWIGCETSSGSTRIVEARLGDPELIADQSRYQEVARRYSELGPIVEAAQQLRARTGDLEAAKEMLSELDGDDREEMRAEVAGAEADIERLEAELQAAARCPKDPNDGKNVIVEIRGAEGGEEANLFARDLFDMYQGYAGRMGWKLEVLGSDAVRHGRLQRGHVPAQGRRRVDAHEARGRPAPRAAGAGHREPGPHPHVVGHRHRAAEAEEVEVDIDPNDLQIDVYRSSGPGGQSVNTTDSAVRITHKPTGLVVAMQDEKSQIQNRAKALRVLRSRLLKLEQDRQAAELSAERKGQVGGGGRSEKIRTYNFKENRVTDHRIGLTIYKLDKVLAGELDDVGRRAGRRRAGAAAPGRMTVTLPWRRAAGRERRAAARRRASTIPSRRSAGSSSGRADARRASRSRRSTTRSPSARCASSTRWSARRAAGEPLQYVLGRWGFRTLDLLVDRRVLIPRPGDRGGRRARHRRAARSGGVAGRPRHRLGRHRAVARRRAVAATSRCGPPTRRPTRWRWPAPTWPASVAGPRVVRLVEGDWFDALPDELRGRVDVVVSQPALRRRPTTRCPPEVADWEPRERARRRARPASRRSSAIVAGAPELAARPAARSWSRSARPRATPSRRWPEAAGFADVRRRARTSPAATARSSPGADALTDRSSVRRVASVDGLGDRASTRSSRCCERRRRRRAADRHRLRAGGAADVDAARSSGCSR